MKIRPNKKLAQFRSLNENALSLNENALSRIEYRYLAQFVFFCNRLITKGY